MEINDRIPSTPGELQGRKQGAPQQSGGADTTRDMFLHAAGSPVSGKKAATINKAVHGALPAKPAVESPFDKVTLIERDNSGNFLMTEKVPCDCPKDVIAATGQDGKEKVYFISEGRRGVYGYGEGGEIFMDFTPPAGERVAKIAYSPQSGSLFARNWAGIYRVNGETGSLEAERIKPNLGFGFHLTDNNRLVISDEDEATKKNYVRILDENLKVLHSTELGERTDQIRDLPGGSILCLDDSCPANVYVVNGQGEKVLEEHNVKLHSTSVDSQGRLYCVSDSDQYSHKNPREVVRFDPGSGEVLRTTTAHEVDEVIARKDGSFIAFDHRAGNPRLIAYSDKGDDLWNFTIRKEHHLRHFYMTEDESTAYLVLDKYNNDAKDTERKLYRLDLNNSSGFLGKIGRSFSRYGTSNNGELIYTQVGEYESFIPAQLSDGRLAIFEPQGITVFSPEGKAENTYGSLEAFHQDVKGKAEVVTKKVPLETSWVDREQQGGLPADLNETLAFAERWFRSANPSCYSLPADARAGAEKHRYSSFDKTLNFYTPADQAQVCKSLGLQNEQHYLELLEGHTVLNFALQDSIDMPLDANLFGPSRRAVVTKNNIEITGGNNPRKNKSFGIHYEKFYSTVLPVSTGQRNFIFAATNDGMLLWYDMDKGTTIGSYDAGAGVKKLAVGPDNRVYAVNVNNGIMAITPQLEKGEALKGAVELSDLHTGVSSDDAIVEEDNFVIIGGLRLEKHPERT